MKSDKDFWLKLKDLHGDAAKIARATGVNYQTVSWNMRKYGISSGPKADAKKVVELIDKVELVEKYKELKSLLKLEAYYGVCHKNLLKYIPKHLLAQNRTVRANFDKEFFSKDSELSFYYAGFLAADGCLKLSHGKYKEICLALASADGEEVRKFSKAIKHDGQVRDYKINQYDKNGRQLSKCVLNIRSNEIFDDLGRFGLTPRKSLTYQMPEWLPQHPLFHHFLRGYFDGDGGVWVVTPRGNRTIKQVYTGICGTKEFLEQVEQVLAEKLSINGSKKQKKLRLHTGIHYLNYGGNKAAASLHDYIYKDATVWMERKRVLLAQAHGWIQDALAVRRDIKVGKPCIKRRRPIIATNLATGEEYHLTGAPEAVARWGFSRAAISDCTRGIQASHRGWTFRYADATNIN